MNNSDDLNNENFEDNSEKFSNDPEEHLRIENELLRIKLQAETGTNLQSFGNVIPPEIENIFLQNIIAFERQYNNVEEIPIHEMLDGLKFIHEKKLSDRQLSKELKKLKQALEEKCISVDFIAEYPERVKYKFITEELIQMKVQKFDIEGMNYHFIYEDFHPNDQLDVKVAVTGFFVNWFNKFFPATEWLFLKHWRCNDGTLLTKKRLQKKLNAIFEAYTEINNGQFNIENIDVVNHFKRSLLKTAIATGKVEYEVSLEDGNHLKFEGEFRLFLEKRKIFWEVYEAKFPGWEF